MNRTRTLESQCLQLIKMGPSRIVIIMGLEPTSEDFRTHVPTNELLKVTLKFDQKQT
jgi:hypothetical protein